MFIKKFIEAQEISAGDNTLLREILHPDNDKLPIGYSIALARLEPNTASKKHYLRSSEVYIFVEGEGIMHIGMEQRKIAGGDLVFVPPRAMQFLTNTGEADLVFFCICEPRWKEEDEQTF